MLLTGILLKVFRLFQNFFIDIIQRYRRIAVFVQQQNQIHLQICFNVVTGRPISIAGLIVNNDFDFF